MSERAQKATVSKKRFDQVVSALMHVGKDEVAAIMEAEKQPRTGKKRGRKPKS